MYYDKRGRILLSSYLPQKPCIDKISCKDEDLKQKIILLLNLINSKINIDKNWTLTDYTKFRNKLATMEVDTFKIIFPEMLRFLELSKEELENKLRDLNQKADTHVFDNERVNKTIIDPETDKIKQEYEIVSHCFEVSDLVNFLCRLISKINKYNNVLINHYHNQLKSNGTIAAEQEKIKLLIEMAEKNELDILNMIKKEYQEWSNSISTDEIIGSLIERMLGPIIQNNIKTLKEEVQKLEIEKNEPYYSYASQVKYSYMAYKKKEELSRSNKKASN